jgi:hypothetical protein
MSTVIFTALYHLGARYFGYAITLSWLYLFVVFGAFTGGLRAGLLAAIFVAGYSLYVLDDTSRSVQVAIAVLLSAVLVGWLRRRLRAEWQRAEDNQAAADLIHGLNGNIERVRGARAQLLDILEAEPLNEGTRLKIRGVLNVLNNLEQATAGWRQLRELKKELDKGE